MAFAFTGQAVATSIIDKVIGAAHTAMEENLLPASDVEAELRRLQRTLPQIKAVLSVVESGEFNNQNKGLIEWMWQFRDAVDCANDVFDEMAYYELEEKIQKQNEMVGSSSSGLKRKLNSFANIMFKADNHGILKKLAKAVKVLDEVASSVHNFLYLLGGSGIRFQGKISEDKNVENDRETGSMITENVVFGREKERDSIVEWLTTEPSIGDGPLSAFTIYGIGGMGKTTLVQLIYNDERVMQFFDVLFWVCVSDQFDAVTIITKILEAMSNKKPKVSSLTTLQDILKKKLSSKKFFLVLDDVWNDENKSQWEKVVAPLKFGYGKILLTTRMESVASMAAKVIEGKIGHLKLGGLEEEQFFMLFKKHAFDGVKPEEFINLHPIGKQIAEKLKGSPLAAKIMGGVLNYYMDSEYWNKVLKENVPNFDEAKEGIMIVLRLSYSHLPTYLQLCFRYCSIFPKDYEFSKDELIKMWMGSGLIEPFDNGQIPEDVGRYYFNCLIRKSFFDLKKENIYVMHDLLHDLAESVSEGECLRIDGSYTGVSRTIRHLSFNMENLLAIREISHLKHLCTLLISFHDNNPSSNDIKVFCENLSMFKSLRLLKIVLKSFIEVYDTIGELIHLRYLCFSLRYGNNQMFPLSICKLYHLEMVNFQNGFEQNMEVHEANYISNLTKIRYLNVGRKIIRQIPCIGKLVFLRELNSFRIGPERGHTISELRYLGGLHKLHIENLNEISNPIDAKEANLNEKEHLSSLFLSWLPDSLVPGESICSSPETHEYIADNLQPHIHLQELVINGYGGMRYSTWMTHLFLENLISLELSDCCLLASLLPLGKLPLLKCLCLQRLPRVKKIDQTFYGNDTECSFPALKKLVIFKMPELQEWEELRGMIMFPQLEYLTIEDCPKLRKLVTLPPSLKILLIRKVGLDTLPSYNDSIIPPASLSYLHVFKCPNITSLEGCMLEQPEMMQALRWLSIRKCERLMHLPSKGFKDFTSLKDINIGKCAVLVAAPGAEDILLPCSLQYLTIGPCELDVRLLRSLQNCTALTKLVWRDCSCISSVSLFEILATLSTLEDLKICDCAAWSSLDGLKAITSLRFLNIKNCDKLTTMSLLQPPLSVTVDHSNLLRLDQLTVDRASLLLLEPLRSLRFTKELVITEASGRTCMPEEWLLQNRSTLRRIFIKRATSLEHLPSCMDKLLLLECLMIRDAQLIQSLPDLPPTLNSLLINGCHPVLKERYKKDTGSEWHKIAFISEVRISIQVVQEFEFHDSG